MSEKTFKTTTSIRIRTDILKHAKLNKIVLSDFFEQQYVDKYLSKDSKLQEIKMLSDRISELNKEIFLIDESEKHCYLTDMEIRFIKDVPRKIRNGAELSAVLKFFNNEFKRDFDLAKFRSLVSQYESIAQKQVEIALTKGRKR